MQSILPLGGAMDCFAALAMTVLKPLCVLAFEIKSGIFTNPAHHHLFGGSGISHCLENALW
jgi:hypothetical protein